MHTLVAWTGSATLLILAVSLPVSAVELEPDRLYPGGTQVDASGIGLGMRIPDGWQGALPAGSSIFVMESATLQAMLLVYAETLPAGGLYSTLAQTLPLDTGVVLEPVAAPATDHDLVVADYRVSGRPDLRARIVGRHGDNGLAVALIALTGNTSPEPVWAIATDTARTLRFFAAVPTVTTPGAVQDTWQDYMRGRYIARFYSGSGYHEKQELWLCSDGRFQTAGDAGGFGGGASGAFANSGGGQWHAEGSLPAAGSLVLQYGPGYRYEGSTGDRDWTEHGPGGQQVRYTLTLRDDKLFLDGTQWLRGDNSVCR